MSGTVAMVMKNRYVFWQKMVITLFRVAYYFVRLYQMHGALYLLLNSLFAFLQSHILVKVAGKHWQTLRRFKTLKKPFVNKGIGLAEILALSRGHIN